MREYVTAKMKDWQLELAPHKINISKSQVSNTYVKSSQEDEMSTVIFYERIYALDEESFNRNLVPIHVDKKRFIYIL